MEEQWALFWCIPVMALNIEAEFTGYHNSISFEEYQANQKLKKDNRDNNTVYWNPNLQTNDNGKAVINVSEGLIKTIY